MQAIKLVFTSLLILCLSSAFGQSFEGRLMLKTVKIRNQQAAPVQGETYFIKGNQVKLSIPDPEKGIVEWFFNLEDPEAPVYIVWMNKGKRFLLQQDFAEWKDIWGGTEVMHSFKKTKTSEKKDGYDCWKYDLDDISREGHAWITQEFEIPVLAKLGIQNRWGDFEGETVLEMMIIHRSEGNTTVYKNMIAPMEIGDSFFVAPNDTQAKTLAEVEEMLRKQKADDADKEVIAETEYLIQILKGL